MRCPLTIRLRRPSSPEFPHVVRSPATGAEAEILETERVWREQNELMAVVEQTRYLAALRELRRSALAQPNPTRRLHNALACLDGLDRAAATAYYYFDGE